MRSITIAIALFACAVVVSAQDTPKQVPVESASKSEAGPPKQISGGVLNGQAISLPKPPFPPAARAIGASGAVSVQVLIDEEGNVASATAVSGHPLLRAAAVEAAREAKFAPTRLQGMPVRVSGIITYNFVGPLYASKMGYTVAYAVESGKFEQGTHPRSLAAQLPPDWDQEIATLNALTFEPEPKQESVAPQPAPSPERPRDPNKFTIKGDINFSAAGSGTTYAAASHFPERLDPRSIAALRDLIPQMASRHENGSVAAWSFELGRLLGELAAAIDNKKVDVVRSIAEMEIHVGKAPSTVNESAMVRLRNLIETGKSPDVNLAVLRQNAQILANFRY
ncbi:MAG TPA: energy transducer TonB [Pyrinomonadaceae bacterium]|nr:energy transducer TonB [Pyrinomonadaceae bacterium]